MAERLNALCNSRVDGPAGAPVLVLSNSLGTDLALWDEQIPALAARFRVLRYDTRGHGKSAVTPGPYTVESLARDVLAMLDELKIQRAHFCGLSLGGMIGMWLGVHAGERIDRLVLANTAPRIGTPEIYNTRIDAVRNGGMEAVADTVLERWFTADFRARSPQQVGRIRTMLMTTPVDGYVACCTAVRDADLWPDIAGLKTRTLILAGAHDVAAPPADGKKLAERIVDGRCVELDAAHISNVEAADRFTAEVIGFLGV